MDNEQLLLLKEISAQLDELKEALGVSDDQRAAKRLSIEEDNRLRFLKWARSHGVPADQHMTIEEIRDLVSIHFDKEAHVYRTAYRLAEEDRNSRWYKKCWDAWRQCG